jgi:hypothetical protein
MSFTRSHNDLNVKNETNPVSTEAQKKRARFRMLRSSSFEEEDINQLDSGP